MIPKKSTAETSRKPPTAATKVLKEDSASEDEPKTYEINDDEDVNDENSAPNMID